MKHLLLIFIALSTSAIAQTRLTFIEKNTKNPIYGVSIYDCNKQLQALSNEKGSVEIARLCFPVYVRHFEYETIELTKAVDTVYLTLNYNELQEITVKPINKMDLYTTIITNSSQEVLKNEGLRYGTFFQAVMIVDQTRGDTSYIDRSCAMAVKTSNQKNKKDYKLYCANEVQSFVPFKRGDFDTAVINNLLSILPSFESNFDYDLTQPKEYKLKFEEKEIKYTDGEPRVLRFDSQKPSGEKSYTACFGDSLLYNWSYLNKTNRPYDNQKLFVNFDRMFRYYSYDTSNYELNGLFNHMEMTFFTNGTLYKIYLVQGFQANDQNTFPCSTEVTHLKKHFEGLPYAKAAPRFYVFE